MYLVSMMCVVNLVTSLCSSCIVYPAPICTFRAWSRVGLVGGSPDGTPSPASYGVEDSSMLDYFRRSGIPVVRDVSVSPSKPERWALGYGLVR